MALPETFPSTVAVLPRFQELVDAYRDEDGALRFPDGVTARALLQQATRETLTGMGLDVSGLTDAQMSDNHGWVLFPNFFMTMRAGECHVIMAAATSRRRSQPVHLARRQLHVAARRSTGTRSRPT